MPVGTATVNFGTGVGVTQDATKKWWFPATDQEWTRLLRGTKSRLNRRTEIINPKRFYNCQDAAAPIVEANGTGDDMTLLSGNNATFQSVTTGFSRFGILPSAIAGRYGVSIGSEMTEKQPGFFLGVRHTNTIPTGFSTLSGFNASGSVYYKVHRDGTGSVNTLVGQYGPAIGSVATTVALPDVDLIYGILINHDVRDVRERLVVLNNQTRDNLFAPNGIGTLSDLVGTVTVTGIGDPAAAGSPSDATLMYCALWSGLGLINDPISMLDAYEIIRRIQEGPDDPFPGSNEAIVTVGSQTGITTSSHVEAWVQGNDSTADHNTYEHSLVQMECRPENIVNNTSFDIRCSSEMRLSGTFKVHWVWSN